MDTHVYSDLSQRYNKIDFVHEQRSWLLHADARQVLLDLANIFIRHGANTNFAITLLHRHHQLHPGHAMIHVRDCSGADICSMEQLGTRQIYPCAYHCLLDQDTPFLPFEFSSDPLPTPDPSFLSDVANYLRLRNLCNRIGVSYTDGSQEVWTERLLDNGQGTIAVVASQDQASLDDNYIVTEWFVSQDENGINTVAIKGCNDQEVGHSRK
ncbi:hypothetical protein M409DRAFT_30571 [Zasmidium cellare ATCC 36951]|uniref:Uncharacterized protein n=1 Tax=Zasmidium cellare ATCC 36951 TaxID=1080233 RepID=A0A6A6BYD7_ZASCE|nr:uncharacterized protein M409DRAFT_30571 [Zasmidium cellare ATCC 36951]KAF2158940.1 hypothetical protein M409DRAFT_30571 [Zasmidium cellare ATCC 36951]